MEILLEIVIVCCLSWVHCGLFDDCIKSDPGRSAAQQLARSPDAAAVSPEQDEEELADAAEVREILDLAYFANRLQRENYE